MNRRAFIGTLAGGLLAAPLAAEAQQLPKVPRIGVLDANPLGGDAFRDGLRQFGYVEGKNIVIEWRWGHARAERFPELAAELVALKAKALGLTIPPSLLLRADQVIE